MQLIFLCLSIGTAFLLASSYSQSEPHDRSVFELVVSITVAAGTLYAFERYYPSFFITSKERKGRFDAIPLNELDDFGTVLQKAQITSKLGRSTTRNHGALLFLAIVLSTVRIELYRRISEVAQCTFRSSEVWLPFILAINECRYQQRARFQSDEQPGSDTSHALTLRVNTYLLNPVWRFVAPALLLSYGCYMITGMWQAQSSTFICPIVSGEQASIPRLQRYATILDGLIAVLLQEIARSNSSSRQRSLSTPSSCAVILFGAGLSWVLYSVYRYVMRRDETLWMFVNDTPLSLISTWLTLGQALVFSILVLSSVHCILNHGVYQLSAVLMPSVMLFLGICKLWSTQQTLPLNVSNTSVWSFIFTFSGAWMSYCISQLVDQNQSSRSFLWQIALFVILLILVVPGLRTASHVDFHPVDILMFEAKANHEKYIEYANQSTGLKSAVALYRDRYQSAPPPGFDVWYQYARDRSVLVMDDYDQINHDLLPFRAISPADLRRQTWEMVSNPWNEISGISIRDGKAEIQSVLPTHRWMLEGAATLINKFAQHLPDMDLAFNLNDESRVAVPNSKITLLRSTASLNRFGRISSFSTDRGSTWLPSATEEHSETTFENYSFQKNFHRFGSIGCPANSLSATHPHLSSQSHLCLRCLAPHSSGQFVSNWTLAADMCHQPDMSDMHGFYLSPAAFKTSHELMPVFSQSKASGYNDILYPSPWNYMEKAIYAPVNASGEVGTDAYSEGHPDPPFAEKENIVYWRGATSEGVSAGLHSWRGMTRQRLVHLMNNATSNSDHDRATVLLPNPDGTDRLSYHSLAGSDLVSLGLQQKTDVRIADHVARCGGLDCIDQENEFGLVAPVDFQAHWKYRFLFDMDGAGFSGRFLPFLQSHSLPFKTALFREWYDSRITAWRHFVPIDMRFHGVWSTVAYFAGIDGIWPATGKRYTWEAHVTEGEAIAEEGRKWAGQVLRKEDMEVYFFRLLLEWGRLTDDTRDELGFSLE